MDRRPGPGRGRRHLPRLRVPRKRAQRRYRHRLPGPAPDTPSARAGTGVAGFDELSKICFVTDPVPDKTQPGQDSLGQLPLCRGMACQHAVVGIWVMAHQRGIDDGDPPHRLTNHRERPRPVSRPHPGKPPGRITHRGDRPLQRARPGRRIARMLAVPCGPAASRAEPGVLTARHERGAALLAVPVISHRAMLRVHARPCRTQQREEARPDQALPAPAERQPQPHM